MTKLASTSAALLMVCAALLGGCDNNKNPSKDGSANATQAAGPSGVQLPGDLPAYAQVFPGADVQSVSAANASKTGMIHYYVTAGPDDVLAFYKKNAVAAGLAIVSGEQSGTFQHFGASKGRKSFVFADIQKEADGRTFVQERYK